MNTETLGWRKGVGVLLLFAISFATQGVPSVATSLAAQEQPVRRTVAGFGVFPTLPVVAAAADGKTPALYIIAGDTATWLLTFEGMHLDHDQVIAQLSPDGQNIAYLLLGSWEGSSSLGVVDIEGNRQIFLDKGAGALASEKGAAHEKITSFAWMNNEHILYSKVTSPSTEEAYASWETGRELPARGEIWLTDLVGAEQQCVAEVPVKKILGIASDEESIYFTCSPVQEEESYSGESFCALDITSGEQRVLWPLPSDSIQSGPARNYFDSYTLLSMPNGTQKVLFVGTEFRDGIIGPKNWTTC